MSGRAFDMQPEEFRRFGYQAVDWIAEYLDGTRRYPVVPSPPPGALVDALPASAPAHGEPMEAILADFDRLVIPSVNHWNHPRFFAYFSVSASAPGILGEMLAAALNTNHMLWKSCPAGVELEQVAMDWLREWLRLPPEFFGMIHDTASTSTVHAIAAARYREQPSLRETGALPGAVVYTSLHAHSSIEKGALALGMGQRNVRKIAVDEAFRMRPEALAEAVEQDRDAGLRPCCVVSTVGTTSVTSVDPVSAIQDVCDRYGLWHHIDAAYGGPATLLEENAWMLEGAARADSLVTNPHKWLFTPIDISAFYCRHPDVLRAAFSLAPPYLQSDENPRAVNLMDYGIPLGRRFRALKLWFVMRWFGRERIEFVLRQQIGWARELAEAIAAHPRFELAAPAPLSLVVFRMRGSDDDNRRLLEEINKSGFAFLSGNVLDGRFVLRLAIGNLATRREDVIETWERLQALAG
jgi:aromatic-L-amino-acid decarboxylase